MTARACVSVIIVTYESRPYVAACLNSLQNTAREWLADCQVIDNASNDGVVEFVKRDFHWVGVTAGTENLGYGRAINRAASKATGDYLLILNPDTVVRPDAVGSLAWFLEHRPKAAACGPKITFSNGTFQVSARRGFPTPLNALGYLSGLDRVFPHSRALAGYCRRGLSPDLEVTTDSLSGACMMIRRESFLRVGGFDEDYFLFGEDIDLCWKLRQAGEEIWYVPSAELVHVKGASMRYARKVARREFYRSMKLFMDKRLTSRYPRPTLWLTKLGVDAAAAISRRFR
jgi:O-antigen biosynthesis protein